jgi:hypothetical protein
VKDKDSKVKQLEEEKEMPRMRKRSMTKMAAFGDTNKSNRLVFFAVRTSSSRVAQLDSASDF